MTGQPFPAAKSPEEETPGLPADFQPNADTVRVVVAPDAFKGTASASQAAEWIAEGIQSIIIDCDIEHIPMADGGEGTAELFEGDTITLPTTDAAGRLTEASYVFNAAEATAYIDIAAATGLPAVKDTPVPLTGDTYGTGVLIADAQSRGASTIVLGMGGSATMDGGTGILVALGATPIDAQGHPLKPGGGNLDQLADFDTAHLNIPAGSVDWVLLSDTEFPATGPEGAARIFGPQKGASPEDVDKVDAGLAHLCEVTGVDSQQPGYGAAGAVPVGITWLSQMLHGNTEHVHVVSGARTVAAAHDLREKISNAHFVVTGEGSYDEQSINGKVVSVVTEFAAEAGATVAVCAGTFKIDTPEGVIAVDIGEESDDVRSQLVRAGAQAAVDYLNTSTTQG